MQVLETLLQKDTSKFEEYSLFWRRLHEPLGFRVRSESPIELHAITCVRVPEHYRLGASVYDRGYLFHYEILGRKTVTSLIHNDKYKLVGKDSWGADWTYDDHVSYEYYMHEEVHRIFPFRWSSLNDWIYNSWDWEDRLQRYCKNKVKS